jgi:colicin import membrane protein
MNMQNNSTETSVLVSLRELVSLEDERLAEEEEARRRAEAEAERARKDAIEQARAAEEARRLAEEEARVQRAREQAEEEARLAAIAQAELERARVEAQAVAAQAARDTELAHERALAQHDNERQKTRLKLWGLGVLFAALVGAGGVGMMALYPTDTPEDPRIAQLEREQQELLKDRLSALDALHQRLEDKLEAYEGADLDAVHREVLSARAALDGEGLSDERLAGYESALDRLATEVGRAHRLARLSTLSELHDGLAVQVERLRRTTPTLKKAAKLAEKSRAGVDAADPVDRDLEAFDAALKKLARALADEPRVGGPRGPSSASGTSGDTGPSTPPCDFHDPLCGSLTR